MSETERRIAELSALGLEHERAGRYEAALAAFRESTAISSTYCDHYNAGNMLLQLGRAAEALDEFDRSLACDEHQGEAHCNRGIALARLGRHDQARSAFERALAVQPTLTNAARCLACVLRTLGEAAAESDARRRVAELEPGDPFAWLDHANAMKSARADDRMIDNEPDGVEVRIVEALDRALALGIPDPAFLQWAWREKLIRLGRLAHAGWSPALHGGRAGPEIDYLTQYARAAAAAVEVFGDDAWFCEKLLDAQMLGGR